MVYKGMKNRMPQYNSEDIREVVGKHVDTFFLGMYLLPRKWRDKTWWCRVGLHRWGLDNPMKNPVRWLIAREATVRCSDCVKTTDLSVDQINAGHTLNLLKELDPTRVDR